ncbi:uncharacterized protein KY384_007268 [Bacidia gigantensis]|uniref:uncharacterized protein n=1 Tax=Bacidia gigantensis TaxID=2732470 RepID=UPI001D0511EE|nr:uncharacterized protein KY384_007268 [Bacidia gigantensis]KAG8528350.1 hypothetical protein KY384_007268 [Bacidia gigantensis]
MAPQTWFITGVSSGFGTEMALSALSAGDHVIGTVRSTPSRSKAASSASAVSAIESKGGKILHLDVTDSPACSSVFKEAESIYGQVDVLFAVEGLSESLARETAPHNTRVLLVEPGAFRTNFLSAYVLPKTLGNKYAPVNGVLEKFKGAKGMQPGDPAKAAARIVEAVRGTGMVEGWGKKGSGDGKAMGVGAVGVGQVLRLPLGKDSVERYEVKIEALKGDLEMVREAAVSTDYD